MVATGIARPSPKVSVIIPARNEEVCLGACLQSLVPQPGVDFEIIVVDDHSTDHTREIASSFASANPQARALVIDAPDLPPGWTGKNNALIAGVKASHGQWLLFTDADTFHLRGSLARALDEIGRYKADMLSYSPQQIVESFSENSVMPVIFAELARCYRPDQVRDPKSSAAAANGQYILIARDAYDAIGGHAAIADQILEDVALARAVKRAGRKIRFRYAADAVRTRMYRNFSQLREGWTKNLALLFPSPGRLAALRLIEFFLISASFVTAIFECVSGNWGRAAVTGGVAAITYWMFFLRVRRAHFGAAANALAIFGFPFFAYLLLRSRNFHRRGLVKWKGRIYLGPARDFISPPDPSVAESKRVIAANPYS